MDRQQFATWAAALQTYYPRFNLLPNPEAMSLWYDDLKDIPVEVLTASLKKWVATEKWPPTIADLRAGANELVSGALPDWGDGWMEVRKAVSRWGYMQKEEALKGMSPATRQAVERIGWQAICESENPDVIRAQFRQAFEACARREAEERNYSPELRSFIQNLQIGQGVRPALEG